MKENAKRAYHFGVGAVIGGLVMFYTGESWWSSLLIGISCFIGYMVGLSIGDWLEKRFSSNGGRNNES